MRYTEVWRQFFIRFWKETPNFRGGSAPAGLRCSSTRCLRAQSRVQVTVRGTMESAQSSPGWVLVWVGPAKARLRPLQITASAAMGQGPVPSSCPGPAWLETISQAWPQPEALQPQPQLGGADSHQTPEPQLPPAEAGALPWPDQRKTNPGEATEAVQHPLLQETWHLVLPLNAAQPVRPRVQAQLIPSVHLGMGAGCPQAWLVPPSPTASSAGAAGWRPGPWRPSWPQ